jgi:hypothetical protein
MVEATSAAPVAMLAWHIEANNKELIVEKDTLCIWSGRKLRDKRSWLPEEALSVLMEYAR